MGAEFAIHSIDVGVDADDSLARYNAGITVGALPERGAGVPCPIPADHGPS